MLPHSSDFATAIKATIRRPIAKLDVIWTDQFIDPTLTATATDNNRGSLTSQAADGNVVSTHKWAYIGPDLIADGSFYVMPDSSFASTNQVGWYSATASNASSVFSPALSLTVTFEAHPIKGLFIVGDTEYEEYPVEFDVKIYDGLTLLHTVSELANSNVRYYKDITSLNIDSATKMILDVKKWSAPNRVAKIVDFYTSLQDTFYSDNIKSISLLEERILADGSLPIGNISCNEVDIELGNIELKLSETEKIIDPFFPENPNSEYSQLIKPNRKIMPYIGLRLPNGIDEYIKLGTFWTGDWNFNESSPTITVTARDRMELLRNAEFSTSILYENKTLYELMVAVLEHAKDNIPMQDLSYIISDDLKKYIIPYAWFPVSSYFNAIKTIVEACMGQAYMSRDDVLIIEGNT